MKSVFLMISVLTFSLFSDADIKPGPNDKIFIVENWNDETVQNVLKMIQEKSKDSEILFFGESHWEPKLQQIFLGVAHNQKNQFDCVSYETIESQPAFNYLNRLTLSADMWRDLYRSSYRHYYDLLTARGWSGFKYEDSAADKRSSYFWKFHDLGYKFFAHEAPIELFLDTLWDLQKNNPGYSNSMNTYKEYFGHSLVRNRAHAKAIAHHFTTNNCKGMMTMGGGLHYLTFEELVDFAAKQGFDLKMERSDAVHQQVKKLIGKKQTLMNLMVYENATELQLLLKNNVLGDSELNFYIKR